MAARFASPYTGLTGIWLRGSFHGHCSQSSGCASLPLQDSVDWYAAAGVDFLAITDHDRVTPLADMRRRHPELILLEGFEHSAAENMLFVGETVEPLYELPLGQALSRARAGTAGAAAADVVAGGAANADAAGAGVAGAAAASAAGTAPGAAGPRAARRHAASPLLTMVCHPRPRSAGPEYWTLAKLLGLGVLPDGVEIYNGHYGTATARAHGRQPLGTELWDELLTAGHRLWGFANDDSHDPEDLGNAWSMICAAERTAAAVVAAARAGHAYATTGLLLRCAEVAGDELRIELAAPATGRFIGPGGTVLSEAVGTSFCLRAGWVADRAAAPRGATIPAGAEAPGGLYARFEAEGEPGRIFLQPAFLTPSPRGNP